MSRLIGFGLNTVDRSESGAVLNTCISNTLVNASTPFFLHLLEGKFIASVTVNATL